MALARHAFTVQDATGALVPSVLVEVRQEVGGLPLAPIYQDRDGLIPFGNPVLMAQSGAGLGFFVEGGAYRLILTTDAGSETIPYVAIGTAAENDAETFAGNTEDDAETPLQAARATPGNDTGFSDFDALPSPGLFGLTGSPVANSPNAGLSYQAVNIGDTARGAQIAIRPNQDFMWFRRIVDSVWASWVQLFSMADKATDAQVRSATADKVMTTDRIETASAVVSLTDAATIALDWDTGINFTVTLTANRILGNPTNGQIGTWRTVRVLGNDGTDRTLTFGNQYFGAVPTLNDIDSTKQYLLTIYCFGASEFMVKSTQLLP